MRNATTREVIQDKPISFIGNPMCGPFGDMSNINYSKMIEEEKDQRIGDGWKHFAFCLKLYELQWRDRRYFLHEHPEIASPWGEDCAIRMPKRQGIVRVTGDQCRYGFKSHDGRRERPARKRTGFMTNPPCIAKKSELQCPNRKGRKEHDHVIFINGRARAAQVYPPECCRAMCEGFVEQLEVDRKGQFSIANVNTNGGIDTKQLMEEAKRIKERHQTMEEDDQQ